MNSSDSIAVYGQFPKRLINIVPLEARQPVQSLGLPALITDASVATLLFFVLTLAGLATGAGRWPAMVAAGVLVAFAWGVLAFWRWKPLPPAPSDFTIADAPDEQARVALVAPAPLAYRVLCDPPLATEVFEPRVFRVKLPLAGNVAGAVTLYVLLNIVLGSGLLLARMFTPLAQTAAIVPVGPWDVWLGMSLSLLPFMVLSPTYLRFTPGKLEILRYGLFALKPASVETFDLWRNRVTAVPTGGYLLIEEPGARLREQRAIIACNVWQASRADVARAALEAATVHEETPPLPTEQLTA